MLYNEFNKIYYTASLVILFGSFGFYISISLLNFTKLVVLLGVVLNTIITFFILYFTPGFNKDFIFATAVIIYSIIYSLIGIYSFKILFDGDYIRSSLLMFLTAFTNILIIPLAAISRINISISIIISATTALLLTYRIIFVKEQNKHKNGNFKDLYVIGLSAFIINNIVPFALIANKYIANQYFDIITANAYTFAWGITAPIFYIGVLVEKMMYSFKENSKTKILKNSFLLLTIMILIYNAALIAAINYFTFLLPKSIDLNLFRKIIYFMTSGYSIYVLFHFPVNGYLFKFSKIVTQEKVALWFFVFTIISGSVLYLIKGYSLILGYQQLLIAVWFFIFSLLGIKIFLMLSKRNNLSDLGG